MTRWTHEGFQMPVPGLWWPIGEAGPVATRAAAPITFKRLLQPIALELAALLLRALIVRTNASNCSENEASTFTFIA